MAGSGFLGQYLLEHGYITADQLLRTMRLVESRNEKFGDVAVALGMINVKIRDEVLEKQHQELRPFGEVALGMGVMRADEIDHVLAAQKAKNLAFGDAAVELGFITREKLDEARSGFDAFYRSTQDVDLSKIADSELREYVRWTIKLLETIAGIKARVSSCEIEQDPIHVVMHAHTFGWSEFHLMIGRELSSRILKEWTGGWQETPELLDDVMRELLNTIVGKTFSSSPVGRRIKIDPPYSSPLRIPEELKMVSLETPDGCLILGHTKGRRTPGHSTGNVSAAAARAVAAGAEGKRERKALIVDDSRLVRRMLHDMLAELGFKQIVEAGSADEAVERAAEVRPDLITLDITLPDASGLDLLKHVLAVSPASHVLMVTAADREAEVKEAMSSGASGYFTKPVDMQRLQATLSRLYLV
jgi:two-component system chemotaxis response regulator CheY